MLNIKTVYRKQLFENLRIGRCTLKAQKQNETLTFPYGKKEDITRYFQFKKLIACFEKEKRCLSAEKKGSDISLEKISEALKYSNHTFSKSPKINFKLDKFIDIFYSKNIPPTIKSKRNVIIIIENGNLKKINKGRMTCPDCFKEQIFKELKRKIADNLKELIVLIRRKLLRGLKNKKEFILDERPKPGILIMDDLAAPFPEMDTDPKPVFSFAEDKPQEWRKCNTESGQKEPPKQNSDRSTPQDLFYQWSKEYLLKDDDIESSTDEERSTPTEKPIFYPPPYPENCLKSPRNIVEYKDSLPKLTYNKNSFDVITRNQPDRENKDYNTEKSNNLMTSENNLQNRNLNNNSPNLLNPPKVSTIVEDICLSTLDLSNPCVAIIPVLKSKEKGKRNIIIKLKNVPDNIDVIKIRSIMSNIYNACEVKNYSKYFLKNRSKPPSCNIRTDSAKNSRQKIRNISYSMTCPNKTSKPTSKITFPSPYLSGSNTYSDRHPASRSSHPTGSDNNLRCYKKNDYFYDNF